MTLWGKKNFWGEGKKYDEGFKSGYDSGYGELITRMITKSQTLHRIGDMMTLEQFNEFIEEMREKLKDDVKHMEE